MRRVVATGASTEYHSRGTGMHDEILVEFTDGSSDNLNVAFTLSLERMVYEPRPRSSTNTRASYPTSSNVVLSPDWTSPAVWPVSDDVFIPMDISYRTVSTDTVTMRLAAESLQTFLNNNDPFMPR